jgi:hypothetical protein
MFKTNQSNTQYAIRNTQYAIRGSIIMFCLFFIFACNEGSLKDQSTNNVNTLPQNDPPQEWENPNNPYDTIGYYHNEGEDYIISQSQYFNCNDTLLLIDQFCNYTADYYCSLGWYSGQGNCQSYAYNAAHDAIDVAHELTITEIIEEYAVDNDAENELSSLFDIIDGYHDSTQIDNIYTDIKNWETNVINAHFSTECEKQLLGTSSVLRYSIHYWTVQFSLGESNPWLVCSESLMNSKNDKILGLSWYDCVGILVCAAADGIGFAEGGLIGAISYTATAAVLWWGD